MKHCIIVFILLFEALSLQPYYFLLAEKKHSGTYNRNVWVWDHGLQLIDCLHTGDKLKEKT